MKKNYSDITIVLDRSGSMASCRDDVIGGFNTFIEEQKKTEGEATISLYQFDDKYEAVYENRSIGNAEKLTKKKFVPRGSTALFDAVGKTIASLGERYENMKEEVRPEKVFFVIITDGEENASVEYTFARVGEMIERQQTKYAWQFVFIGSELKAVDTAVSMGFKRTHVMNFDKSAHGIDAVYKSMSKNITKMRVHNSPIDNMEFFDDEDKKKQDDIKTVVKKKRKSVN